jgi:hypothetical protein
MTTNRQQTILLRLIVLLTLAPQQALGNSIICPEGEEDEPNLIYEWSLEKTEITLRNDNICKSIYILATTTNLADTHENTIIKINQELPPQTTITLDAPTPHHPSWRPNFIFTSANEKTYEYYARKTPASRSNFITEIQLLDHTETISNQLSSFSDMYIVGERESIRGDCDAFSWIDRDNGIYQISSNISDNLSYCFVGNIQGYHSNGDAEYLPALRYFVTNFVRAFDSNTITAWNPINNSNEYFNPAALPDGWLTELPIEIDSSSFPLTLSQIEVDGESYTDDCEYTFFQNGVRYSLCDQTEEVVNWELSQDKKELAVIAEDAHYRTYLLDDSESTVKVVVVDSDETFSVSIMEKRDSTPYISDTDLDSIPDVIDTFPSNPNYSQDTDSDGVPDEWELSRIGNLNDSASSDSDRDGLTTMQEFEDGTDPLIATVMSGFTQSDIDSAVATCVSDPSSCGIDIGYTEEQLDEAILIAIAECSSDPVVCGISASTASINHPMKSGWNLIGGKDASDTASIQSFMSEHNANSVWHWNDQWYSYVKDTPEFLNSLITMDASKGYFVYVQAQK